MKHARGKPYHPMTQGKIERWHLSLKSRILLENYYLPGDLERAVAGFVEYYNIGAITRAWTISRQPTSTSAKARVFCNDERRLNARPSSNDAGYTWKT
jgi:transposase InsO family protein